MKEGDFVELNFTGKVNGKVFETTIAEEAKKAGFYDEKRVFKPVLIVAGKKMIVPGLDEEVLNASEGNGFKSVSLSPEKAFGLKKPELLRLIPISKFKEQGIEVAPGLPLDIDGMPARVVAVEGGRVRVDFNHPLAGQNVEYSFKVEKVYSDSASKLQSAAKYFFESGVSAKLDGSTARFSVPASARKDAVFLDAKFRAIDLLLNFVPDVKSVFFEEEYSAQQPHDVKA
ncbi:MAG: peptidylprolyl isomerase [Candidatus Micrarchaeota archaeon]